jgi:hypothetical protein
LKLAIAALIVGLAAAAAAQDAVGTRIGQSAGAAERLQGPLDGTWTLQDAWGRALFVFQIGDPPTGRPLSCAWRTPHGEPRPGKCQKKQGSLTITFEASGKRRVVLHLARGGVWRGELFVGKAGQPVSLRRR